MLGSPAGSKLRSSTQPTKVNSSNKFTIAVGFDFAQPTEWPRVERSDALSLSFA
ncbi:hypothetical protein [Nostoc sp. NMS7]|uniref:hypothetical protein n=1 Tax=Nostoc sp. NMS7 TaxID=2815391 RepID=UPI0025F4C53A|nr:hypothetical protein [Nostoc sp. NMS7]